MRWIIDCQSRSRNWIAFRSTFIDSQRTFKWFKCDFHNLRYSFHSTGTKEKTPKIYADCSTFIFAVLNLLYHLSSLPRRYKISGPRSDSPCLLFYPDYTYCLVCHCTTNRLDNLCFRFLVQIRFTSPNRSLHFPNLVICFRNRCISLLDPQPFSCLRKTNESDRNDYSIPI